MTTTTRSGAARRRSPLHVLWATTAVGGLAQSLAGASGGLLAEQVAGTGAAGLPQTFLVVGAAISAIGLSRVSRSFGRAVSLATGAAIAVVGCALMMTAGVLESTAGLAIGSLLLGSGNTSVMLARYAGAEVGPADRRARSMASVLVATTAGAVAGPNLLAPAGGLAEALGLPTLLGPYAVAAVGFGATGVALLVGIGTEGPSADRASSAGHDAELRRIPSNGRRNLLLGLIVMAGANLVMVAVMTMAPIHLRHEGAGLAAIGLVVSLHIAGMFAPSPASGLLTDRYGARPACVLAAGLLVAACLLAAGASSTFVLGLALVLLGVGWNVALVAGSVLVTLGVSENQRPDREAWGEVGMGVAAAVGGLGSGLVLAAGDYAVLTVAMAASVCVLAAIVALADLRAHRRCGRH